MNSPYIAYSPRPDATAEAERSALAAVYRMILNDYEKKNADGLTGDLGGRFADSKEVNHVEHSTTQASSVDHH